MEEMIRIRRHLHRFPELSFQEHNTSAFIRELREQLEADIAVSEEVAKPFKLGPLAKVKAVVGKYVW